MVYNTHQVSVINNLQYINCFLSNNNFVNLSSNVFVVHENSRDHYLIFDSEKNISTISRNHFKYKNPVPLKNNKIINSSSSNLVSIPVTRQTPVNKSVKILPTVKKENKKPIPRNNKKITNSSSSKLVSNLVTRQTPVNKSVKILPTVKKENKKPIHRNNNKITNSSSSNLVSNPVTRQTLVIKSVKILPTVKKENKKPAIRPQSSTFNSTNSLKSNTSTKNSSIAIHPITKVLKQTIPIEMNKTIHVVKNSENEKIDKEDEHEEDDEDDEEDEHEDDEEDDEDEHEHKHEHEHEHEHKHEHENKKVDKSIKREINLLPKQISASRNFHYGKEPTHPPKNTLKSIKPIKPIVVPNLKLHMKIFKTVHKIKRIGETIKILHKRLKNTKIKSHKVKLQNVINSLDARKLKLKKSLTQIKVTKLK